MYEKEKAELFASVGKLENSLKSFAESAKEKSVDIRSFAKVLRETEKTSHHRPGNPAACGTLGAG